MSTDQGPPRPMNVGIIGAGLMGHALALVHALGACNVNLVDSDEITLAQASKLIQGALTTLTEGEAITSDQARTALKRITTTANIPDAIRNVDLVIEAVTENRDIKRAVFAEIDTVARPDAIIASNTSHLNVFPLMPVGRQARCLITHWYTPPYIVDLVDLAPGPETTRDVMERIHALYGGMGKHPIAFESFISGYVANRIQAAMNLEIFHILDEGLASPEDIDDSIRHGLTLRLAAMGQLEKLDYTGLEMVQRGLANRTYEPPVPSGQSQTLNHLIECGRTGVMAGAGFYDYGETPPSELFRQRDAKLLRLKRAMQNIDAELS
jgi:3-hydroxybutyryl-CoA dehydrogenase